MVTTILKILNNSTKNDKMGCNASKSFSNDANNILTNATDIPNTYIPSKAMDILGITVQSIKRPKAYYGPNNKLIASISTINNFKLNSMINTEHNSKYTSAFNRVQPRIVNSKYV